jgi:hypothetical protein
VLLNLGTNTQPSEPKLTNTHSGNLHGLLPVLHRSDRWPAPVRLVDRAGQADGYSSRTTSVPESLSDFSRPWNKNTPKTQPARKENLTQSLPKQLQTDQEQSSNTTTQRHTSPAVHRRQIQPVVRTGQTTNRSTDLNKTLGIVVTPHEESIDKINPTKTCQIRRNRRNPAKNSSNPRTPKPQNRAP